MLKPRDLAELCANPLYFTGKKIGRPRFGRFGYPEKLEYWAVIWLCPRWIVDVATTIHYYEAILACLAIVAWHFYHVLFAPGVYPMNFAWWDGKVSKKWHEEEHPLDSAGAEEPEED